MSHGTNVQGLCRWFTPEGVLEGDTDGLIIVIIHGVSSPNPTVSK